MLLAVRFLDSTDPAGLTLRSASQEALPNITMHVCLVLVCLPWWVVSFSKYGPCQATTASAETTGTPSTQDALNNSLVKGVMDAQGHRASCPQALSPPRTPHSLTWPQGPTTHCVQCGVLQDRVVGSQRPSQRPGSGQVTRRCCSPPPQASEHWEGRGAGPGCQHPRTPPLTPISDLRASPPSRRGVPAEAGLGPAGSAGGVALVGPSWQ